MIIGKIVGFCFLVKTSESVEIHPGVNPYYILLVDELTPVVLLTIVFFMLMKEMKAFHYFEYNKNKKSM